jgi:hypothetical protein
LGNVSKEGEWGMSKDYIREALKIISEPNGLQRANDIATLLQRIDELEAENVHLKDIHKRAIAKCEEIKEKQERILKEVGKVQEKEEK